MTETKPIEENKLPQQMSEEEINVMIYKTESGLAILKAELNNRLISKLNPPKQSSIIKV